MFRLLGFSYITVLYRVFLMFGLLGFSYITVLYRVLVLHIFEVSARLNKHKFVNVDHDAQNKFLKTSN